jgi:hypothetical protein
MKLNRNLTTTAKTLRRWTHEREMMAVIKIDFHECFIAGIPSIRGTFMASSLCLSSIPSFFLRLLHVSSNKRWDIGLLSVYIDNKHTAMLIVCYWYSWLQSYWLFSLCKNKKIHETCWRRIFMSPKLWCLHWRPPLATITFDGSLKLIATQQLSRGYLVIWRNIIELVLNILFEHKICFIESFV